MIGHKRLIYAIDIADKTMDSTRNQVTDFFKKYFGFLQGEIEFVDRTAFYEDKDGIFKTSKYTFEEE